MELNQNFKLRISKNKICALLVICLITLLPIIGQCDIWDPYHTKKELLDMFKDLCDFHPNYASYESVGKSFEENDILIFKIGNPNGGKVLWDAQLHGNEDKGSEVLYLIAKWLLESDDDEAKRILERNYILLIPIINVDSYGRGNKNQNFCRYGVDLNRNFETGWRQISCTDSQNYSGDSPTSEPETKVMKQVFQSYNPNFYVNLHCGAGPYLSYYRYGNVSLAREVIANTENWSNRMGITPYRTISMGSTGFAIGDAGSLGISSWLFEIEGSNCWRHTEELYEELVDTIYPKCLAVFIAMCELSEIKTIITCFEIPIGNETFTIKVESSSKAHNFNFGQPLKRISFLVEDSLIKGFCNITLPKELLYGDFVVTLDGTGLEKSEGYSLKFNGTHNIFYIPYSQDDHKIEITASSAIPEFPLLFSLSIFLFFVISFIILRKQLAD